IMNANFAQTMSSLLWIVILVGRLSCAMLSKHIKKSKLLLFSGAGFAVCFVFLISARSLLPAALGIIGVGFFMAGLYPTTVADMGDTIKQYPLSMSFLLTFAGLGAIIMPSIVGTVADKIGIIGGMSCVVVAALLTFVSICINAYKKRKA
ncbi:MAG: MFS transporter, partial [Oscillospiraceae bacterium]|nr:MFS transporter [Oscillospiraceae bacterium]